MAGIPTTVVTRKGFTQVVANAYAGFGLPAEEPAAFEFPNAMFLSGSDLSPIRENIDKLVAGLTAWKPKVTEKGVYPAPLVTVKGKDYQTAFDNMNAIFMKNLWSDGLPLTPPTAERVNWIMKGTDLAPDTVIGTILPRGGLGTVQSIAVNLAMAGGRPEYMPVLIAAVQAIADPKFELQSISPSTNSNYIAVVVNGPMAKDIRLNSGYSLVGPDSVHPAGQVIGRALAFILQNPGGAVPGIGAMELYGGMRITNAVFAEDEAGLPKDWTPLSVDLGFVKGNNIASVYAVTSATNINTMPGDYTTAEAEVTSFLYRIAGEMHGHNGAIHYLQTTSTNFSRGIVLISRTFAQNVADLGWSKLKVKTFLWDNSKYSWSDLQKLGETKAAKTNCGTTEGQTAHLTAKPEQITLIVAGGASSQHAYWMEGGKGTSILSVPIKLPSKWIDLIKVSETDLGPIPDF